MTQILSFIAVASLLVMSPGPNGVLIARTVPVSGQAAGFTNIAGFVAAFFLHGSLSILGISILLVQSAEFFFVFKMLGAAYLCWIGIKSCVDAWKNEPANRIPARAKATGSLQGAFFEGFLTNALNPKVSMFYLAAFPQFITLGGEASMAYFLVFLHCLINLPWFSAMVFLLSRFKQLGGNPGFSRWIKSVTGVVFIGFGAKLASLHP